MLWATLPRYSAACCVYQERFRLSMTRPFHSAYVHITAGSFHRVRTYTKSVSIPCRVRILLVGNHRRMFIPCHHAYAHSHPLEQLLSLRMRTVQYLDSQLNLRHRYTPAWALPKYKTCYFRTNGVVLRGFKHHAQVARSWYVRPYLLHPSSEQIQPRVYDTVRRPIPS